MQTTIYLGSETIQILQGDVKGSKLTIVKHLTVDMGPGAMINGVITNEDMILDALDRADEEGDIDFQNTTLVINSSLIMNKNVAVPKMKPKELEDLAHHEFEESTNFEDLIVDYTSIKGKQGSNLFTFAIEKEVLDSYNRLFETAGIKLKRIDTALNATVNYIEATQEYGTQTFAINILDGNNLMYALFENGIFTFSSQARIMANRNTEAFTIEMAGKLSSLLQFNKSQKSEYNLERSYYAGLSPEEIKGLKEYLSGGEVSAFAISNTDNIVEKFNIEDEFYLSDYFYTTATYFQKKKDINFLESYKRANKPKAAFSIKNKAAIPPLIIVGIMILGFLVFTIINYNVEKAYKKANKYINDPTNVSLYSEAQKIDSELQAINSQLKVLNDNRNAMNSHPNINSDKIYQIINLGDRIQVGDVTYDWTNGALSINANAPNEFAAAKYVSELNATGLFSKIQYEGYTINEGSISTTTNGSSTTTNDSGQSVTTPNTQVVVTPDTYSFTATAYLKPGVTQQ